MQLICPHCAKECKNKNSFTNHVRLCPKNTERVYVSHTAGHPAWNKDMRGDPRCSRVGINLDYRVSESHKQRLSEVAKQRGFGGYQPNAGHSKKFRVIDSFGKETVLQSTYELECANLLNDMGIRWNRPKAMKYGSKNYFADFYLPDYSVYLDPKNSYKAKLDAEKIAAVIAENKVRLYVLLKEQLTREYIESLMAIRPNGEVAS